MRGVVRGKVVRTMIDDAKVPCSLHRVNRLFKGGRPNQLWMSDFTCSCSWQGWPYVAVVTDVYVRRIAGLRVSASLYANSVADVPEHGL